MISRSNLVDKVTLSAMGDFEFDRQPVILCRDSSRDPPFSQFAGKGLHRWLNGIVLKGFNGLVVGIINSNRKRSRQPSAAMTGGA